ncbi:MAG: baseplate J/gp47 family protein [Patescibacteria group bacterium]
MTHPQRLQRYFSPVLIVFILVVAVLVAAVFYVAFSKTTVAVKLRDVPAKVPFQYSTTDLGLEITETPIDQTFTFTDYEANASEDAVATGTVTIYDETSSNQPLVRTTRLLSDSGILFHTDETVTVPAGGSIEVPVYADAAGASGNIEPDHFEIVALHDSVKAQIYAKSTSPMTGGVIKKVVLTDKIITVAKHAAKAALAGEVNLTAQEVNGTVGDEVNSVEVHSVGKSVVLPDATAAIRKLLLNDNEPITKDAPLTYEANFDGNEWILSGDVETTGQVENLDFIDPTILTDKTEQQIQNVLSDYEQIDSVQVTFVPFWLERTPALAQQINLIIAQ